MLRALDGNGNGYWAATALSDDGRVLRVTTRVDRDGPFREEDALFELAGFVDKRALVPMLATGRARTYDDGSGYWIGGGLPLVLADRARPRSPLAAPLDLGIRDEEVTLSLRAPRPVATPMSLAGGQIGCERVWSGSGRSATETVRVAPVSELEAEADPQDPGEARVTVFGMGSRGFSRFPCAPKDAIAVGGVPVSGADRCGAHPTVAVGDRMLTTVATPLVVVRGVVAESALVAGGGCGVGRMAPQRKPAVVVRAKADVVYPDGSPAGTFRGRTVGDASFTKVDGPTDLLCTTRSVARAPVCFRASEAAEAVVMPMNDE